MENLDYCYRIFESGNSDWNLSSYVDVQDIIQDAIKDIMYYEDYSKNNIYTIEIATCKWYEDTLDADTIVEDMIEKANDELDGFNWIDDNYLYNVNTSSLQEKLDKVWKEWKKEQNVQSPFYYPSDTTSVYIIKVSYNKEKDTLELINYKPLAEIGR